jgi:hypothetical protein
MKLQVQGRKLREKGLEREKEGGTAEDADDAVSDAVVPLQGTSRLTWTSSLTYCK